MKMLFDFLPIALFFLAYKLYGIYVATGVAIVTSLLQVGIYWLKFKRTETMQLITLGAITFLGGATLLLHDEMFIKWKPSVIYWLFGVFFIGSQFIGEKPLIQRVMADQLTLPNRVWRNINTSWAVFFIILGFVNIYVAYHFSTDAWVNFKLFGAMGATFAFILAQSIYISKYMQDEDQPPQEQQRDRLADQSNGDK